MKFCIGILLFYFVSATGSRSTPLKIQNLIDQAEILREWDKCNEARPLLNKAKSQLEAYFEGAVSPKQNAWTYARLALIAASLSQCGQDQLTNANKIESLALQALKLEPMNAVAHTVLGSYYRETSQLSWFEKMFLNSIEEATFLRAKKHLEKALNVDPHDFFALWEMAQLYEDWKKDSKAVEFLNRLLHSPRKDPANQILVKKAQEKLIELESPRRQRSGRVR